MLSDTYLGVAKESGLRTLFTHGRHFEKQNVHILLSQIFFSFLFPGVGGMYQRKKNYKI